MFFQNKSKNPIKFKGNEIKYLKKVIKGETWSSLSGSWVGKAEQLFAKKVSSKYAHFSVKDSSLFKKDPTEGLLYFCRFLW